MATRKEPCLADIKAMKGGFTSHSLRRGMVAVSVAGGIGMMLVAFALAFSNAASAREIAESSQELQWANATAGAGAVSRAALNQALVFTVDVALDVAAPEAAEVARTEAYTTLDALSGYVAAAPDRTRSDVVDVENLIMIGASALSLMEEGNIREADTLLTLSLLCGGVFADGVVPVLTGNYSPSPPLDPGRWNYLTATVVNEDGTVGQTAQWQRVTVQDTR